MLLAQLPESTRATPASPRSSSSQEQTGLPAQLGEPDEEPPTARQYPRLPRAVTSFGAAVADGQVFMYGGHIGEAHTYSDSEQSGELWRLDLGDPVHWETISQGPRLQGLALVAHQGRLYRVGGFTARNAQGEEHDLWSRAEAACFDIDAQAWRELPPLPEARSSHDAAVLAGQLLVVGGWQLAGEAEPRWHETAWSLELSDEHATWRPLANPPGKRRALAVAAHAGKLHVIGGMQEQGGPTNRTDVWDPATGQWSRGADLQGEPMEGFGCAAFATGGHLYASTSLGHLQRLAEDGQRWEIIRQLPTARCFHRMLPLDERHLLILGGANMSTGKFAEVEVVELE